MERDRVLSSEPNKSDPKNPKVIEWEDVEEELARLWSLSAVLKEAKEKKQSLQQKLEALIQVGFQWVRKYYWWLFIHFLA